jgi:hypothetical protein
MENKAELPHTWEHKSLDMKIQLVVKPAKDKPIELGVKPATDKVIQLAVKPTRSNEPKT